MQGELAARAQTSYQDRIQKLEHRLLDERRLTMAVQNDLDQQIAIDEKLQGQVGKLQGTAFWSRVLKRRVKKLETRLSVYRTALKRKSFKVERLERELASFRSEKAAT